MKFSRITITPAGYGRHINVVDTAEDIIIGVFVKGFYVFYKRFGFFSLGKVFPFTALLGEFASAL